MNYIFREQGDHVFDWKKQWMIDNPVRKWVHPPQKLFKGLIETGMTVADTGCGTGFFSLHMARMVGETGRVIAVDLQAEALAHVEKKAEMAGLNTIVETWKCESNDIGILPKLDFALAFYMAHEVPDIDLYFSRMAQSVMSGGRLLLVEPYFHVKQANFESEVRAAVRAGFELEDVPPVTFSHSALLKRA